jgi:hypothetical protein
MNHTNDLQDALLRDGIAPRNWRLSRLVYLNYHKGVDRIHIAEGKVFVNFYSIFKTTQSCRLAERMPTYYTLTLNSSTE